MGDKDKSVGKWSPANIKKVPPLKGEPAAKPKPGRLWEAAKKLPIVERAVINSDTKGHETKARNLRAQADAVKADTELGSAYIANAKEQIKAERYSPDQMNLDVQLQRELADVERQRSKLQADEELEALKHKAELDRRQREEDLKPPPEPKQKPRGPTARERAEAEAERLRKTGTTTMHGEIARKQIDELKDTFGDDEAAWPEEQQEIARDLRLWALRGGK